MIGKNSVFFFAGRQAFFYFDIKRDKGILSVDGQLNATANSGDTIIIKRSSHDLLLITNPQHNYFSILREKMGWGKR